MMKGFLKRFALVVTLCISVMVARAASDEVHFVYPMPALDMRDEASLQRGAKYFMNYCSGCHGLGYMRYSQMAEGIGMTDEQGKIYDKIMKSNLMFTSTNMGDLIETSMDPKKGKVLFGTKIPDLTLETKARGSEWVYNYLLSFYSDPKRPLGVNNTVYPDVAMPNVLAALQGVQKPVYVTTGYDEDKRPVEMLASFELVEKGELTPQEFQQFAYDIVNFMSFAADPKKVQRERTGVIVLLFLVVFTLFAYLLKREYWKDVE